MNFKQLISIAAIAALASPMALASEFEQEIPMMDKGAATFYVQGEIQGPGHLQHAPGRPLRAARAVHGSTAGGSAKNVRGLRSAVP